ncbi:MAG: glycosyltransferase family 39 protein [Nitrospira sp.]|nr:glycosyltransferase family 39 protein [Nitrospira sp.]
MNAEGASKRPVLPTWASIALLLLISGTFLFVGLDSVNEATEPAFEDTPAFLQVALFIKENGGVSNFLHLCLTGAYTAAVQKPLHPLLLSTFASRDMAFFDKAKVVSLAMGIFAIIALFYVARDLYGESVAFLATGGVALNETMIRISSHVQCETTLMLFMLLSLYCMMKGLDQGRYWILAGVFAGLSYMTKGTGLLLVLVFMGATLVLVGPKALRSRHFWAFVAVFFLISSPLIVRNIQVYGGPFYESVNQHALWLDRWDDIYHPRYELAWQFPEIVWKGTDLPTMRSYLASHSVSEVLHRMGSGVRREFFLFLNSLEPHLPIQGASRLVLLLFGIGVLSEIRTPRTLYVVGFMLAIFLPFAWLNQSVPAVRFISVLIPLVFIYFGIGIMVVCQYLVQVAFPKLNVAVFQKTLLALMSLCYAFIAGYVVLTQEVHWPETPAPPSRGFAEISTWFATTVQHDDLVILSEEGLYWRYPWLVGLKGNIAIWQTNDPRLEIGGIASLNRVLDNKRGSSGRYVIVHKDDISRSQILGSHFRYDKVKGLVEVEAIKGWKLIHSHSEVPVEFVIYEIEDFTHSGIS